MSPATPEPDAGEDGLTVAAYETYANRVHGEYTDACATCNDTRGFDRLMDTHFGRRLLSADDSLDGALAAAAELGAPRTVWRKGAMYFLYVAAPSGAAAQLTGVFDSPPAGARAFDTCVA